MPVDQHLVHLSRVRDYTGDKGFNPDTASWTERVVIRGVAHFRECDLMRMGRLRTAILLHIERLAFNARGRAARFATAILGALSTRILAVSKTGQAYHYS